MHSIQYNLIVCRDLQWFQTAALAVAELSLVPDGEVERLAQEHLSVFVEAIFVWNPLQSVDTLLKLLLHWLAADCVSVGPCQRLDFVQLGFALQIIEGLGGAGVGCSGDIIKVFELPVSPGPEVPGHFVGEHSELISTPKTVGQSAELGHESTHAHLLGVNLFRGYLQLVECLAKLRTAGLAQGGHVRTVDVVAENLARFLGLAPDGFVEPASEHVDDTGLVEYEVYGIVLADALVDLGVGGEQELVVGLTRQQGVGRAAVEVGTDGLVEQLVAEQVGLPAHIRSHSLPHHGEVVEQTPLVGEELLLESHHVLGGVEQRKLHAQALGTIGVAVLVIVQVDVEWEGEVGAVNGPVREALPAELSVEQVLVRVQENVYSKFIAFLYDLPKLADVSVIELTPLGLDALPGNMQPDGVETPSLQVGQVDVRERIVRVEVVEFLGVEGEQLLHRVHPMEHHVPSILVQKQSIVGIDRDALGTSQQNDSQQESLDRYGSHGVIIANKWLQYYVGAEYNVSQL